MRRELILALLLMILPLTGCLSLEDQDGDQDDGEAPTPDPNLTSDPAQPAKGNNVLYLHARGTADLWMDLDEDATDTSLTGMVTPGSDETWWQFPLTPASGRELTMTADKAALVVMITSQTTVGTPTDVKARLFIDDAEFSSAERTGHLSGGANMALAVPLTIEAGASMRLDVCVCPSEVSLSVQYAIHTDGASALQLPIATPILDAGTQDEGQGGGSGGAGRSESDVRTYQQNGRWHAEKTVTLTGAVAVNDVELSFGTVNGDVDVSTWSEDSYKVEALLKGQGASEQAARARLDALVVDHDDGTSGGTMDLSTQVQSKDQWRNQTGVLTVQVPPSAAYPDASMTTINGDVSAERLDGGSFRLSTTNGDVTLTDTTVTDVDMSTDNGRVVADVQSTASGTYRLDSINGNVDLTVPDGASYGYDATGDTVNGQVAIDLAGTEPVGSQSAQHKHLRTSDYGSRLIQVEVDAGTVNGNVDIHGA
jgi:hypothetical protein